ncbi:MAG TPA: glycoside hydrolase family 99-like domain-containing protein [Gammaproteobacteria bacterium]|jgi:lipopolysaccharide biosynthesis protein
MSSLPKPVAFYLPQYHAIPENDAWWGAGFTDWVNVRKARPLFRGHYQPRRPQGERYYDLSRPEAIRWQVELARAHGVHGFCHYHYWFDGKQLLETPTNLFLATRDLDLGFCLCWANETWSKRWDGLDHHVLQLQTHEPSREKWGRHFEYLIRAWTDERAIRIGGKPVFVIYRPHKIAQIGEMFDYWQTRAREFGVDGIHFLAMRQVADVAPELRRHFDGVIQFQPFDAMSRMNFFVRRSSRVAARLLPGRIGRLAAELHFRWRDRYGSPDFCDYDATWRQIVAAARDADRSTYPGAFIDWDNTARYGRRATVFRGASPGRFGHWLEELFAVMRARPEREPLLFINAWNEWAEGTYLEPDERHGTAYLEALRTSLERCRQAPLRETRN